MTQSKERLQYRTWISRAVFAVGDQALFAIGNFAMAVILARWLPREEYGGFAVAYPAAILVTMVHVGIFVEPLILRASTIEGGPRQFYNTIWRHNIIAAGAITATAVFIALTLRGLGSFDGVPAVVLSAVVFGSLNTLLILERRFAYATGHTQHAALASGAYLVSLLTVLAFLRGYNHLSAITGLAAMGGTGLILALLMHTVRSPRGEGSWLDPQVMRDQWTYGRWIIISNLLLWVPTNIFYLTLGSAQGLESSADLRALMNVAFPVMQGLAALSMLLLPYFAKDLIHSRVVRLSYTFFVGSAVLYAAAVVAFHRPLFSLVYGDRYDFPLSAVALAAAVPIVWAAVTVATMALKGRNRPRAVTLASAVSAISAAISAPVAAHFGLAASLLAMVGSLALGFATLILQTKPYQETPAEHRTGISEARP